MRLTEQDLTVIRNALTYVLGRMNCDWPEIIEEAERIGDSIPIVLLGDSKDIINEYNNTCDKIETELTRRGLQY